MSKNLCGIAVPRGVAHPCMEDKQTMTTVQEVQKAFHEAVNSGMKLLQDDKITWTQYAFMCVGFELHLREMGADF